MSPLGAVFTPQSWARWALDRLDAPSRVAAGATFCDPTAGEGVFAWALAEAWESAGHFDPAGAGRITLIDREGSFLEAFARKWRERWGWAFPERQLIEADVIDSSPGSFDLVAGNPPWATYPDLEAEDQARYRPWFSRLKLVGGAPELLLGRSRLDVAALVTAKVFESMLNPGGRAGFFLPLSLFHSQGAGRWRRYSPDTVFDLTDCHPFPGVSTRCGWAEFSRTAEGPPKRLPYFTGHPPDWTRHEAVTDTEGAPWRLLPPGASARLPQLVVEPWQRPRQGVNTGGCNAAFHVDAPPPGVDPAFVHPLAGKKDRWILVPYNRSGRLLDEPELESAGLAQWWKPWKDKLAARKGVMLGSQLSKGRWWALLGVGAYTFAPYKVVWSAYGRHRLDAQIYGPREDGAVWQADQALQAYIPCHTEADAHRVEAFLNSDEVNGYLVSLRGAGTKNWAQPGRFAPLLSLTASEAKP